MSNSERIGRRGFLSLLAGTSVAAACTKASQNAQKEQTEKYARRPEWSLPKKNRVKLDFTRDPRSRKVIFVAHCVLNQNARILDAADFPAMFEPLVEALRKHNIGIIQLPCPELRVLGLSRRTVREGLETPEGQAHLKLLIAELIYVIKEYQFQGFHVVGILGKNGSPSCGVTRTYLDGRQQDGQGVFIRLLRETLAAEGLDIDIMGVADHEQEKAIEWVLERI